MTWLWIVPMGLLVGLALGGLGGGGAILTIPALIYLLGEPPATAAAGSLVIVLATCVIGLVPHLRDARVRLTDGFIFGALGILGSVMGSRWSSGVREEVLLSAFAILLIVVAAVMALRARRQGREAPDRIVAQRDTAWLLRLVIAASGVGLLTGFFGVGGGFAVVPALVLVVGLPMREAVATSLLVIAINCATALLARLSGGVQIDWLIVIPFAFVAVLGSLLGAQQAKGVNQAVLGQAFAGLLLLIGLVMAVENFPQVF